MKKIKFDKETFEVSLILILSAILNFANISIEGYANTYYSAGVKSMLMSFKNFFFVSSDPSGFVSIDKPPVGFWLQTISAKIFGFSGWSVILPQALAGVISVWIIYYLVKRSFGSLAGLVAALCLAITPIFVAASRNNTIDNLLVLALLLACWPLFVAAEKGKFKYLILSLVLVGIGFNIKMVEAYLIAPAIYITYFLSSALPYKQKIKHLILGSVVLLVVSLSWAVTVDLVPANGRPFVGSSTNNTVMQLIVGHNGLERVGIGGRNANRDQGQRQNLRNKSNTSQNQFRTEENNTSYKSSPANNRTLPGGNQFGMGNNSKTGITRLFSYNNLSDQISWLLPFAIIGFLAAAIKEKLKYPFDNKKKLSLIFWFMWLLPEFIYFSFSKNVTHTYYLTTMAPSISALTGIGLVAMWKLYNEGGWKRLFLPIAFMINGLIEIAILSNNYNRSNGYKITLIATGILSLGASLILFIATIVRRKQNVGYEENNPITFTTKKNSMLKVIVASIAFIGILTAPMVWSTTTLFYPMNGSSPSAGLELVYSRQNKNLGLSGNSKLIQFLENNKGNEKYLVAVPSAMTYASDLILKTGEPVMTIGGFSGSDKIITLDKFRQLVSAGDVRYALVNGGGRMGGNPMGGNSNNDIMNWIKENGKLVPSNEWTNTITSNRQNINQMFGGFGGFSGENSGQLYDLKINSNVSTK
ncbi:glycosyltransferase family 39 protein [Clostridium sp. PL3]|uniref:Glycosyltransferase family 39 protein n=1 Tax=Clostridium thailandense TaxID=2794346 RepID=A0A949U0L6_9CLOT|nr:glycosyltransferase family 39 protein [Clostridium thailandense]MBV7275155.1 glycosyltransferase family 39 protein [Clostridium thailandense]